MSKLSVTSELRKELLKYMDLRHVVDKRIFPLLVPADTDGASIVIKRVQWHEGRNKFGKFDETATLGVYIICDDYDESVSVAEVALECINHLRNDKHLAFEVVDSWEEAEGWESAGKTKYIQVLQVQCGTVYKG